MFKVVFTLQQLHIRLKQCEADVILKKKKESVMLVNRCRIVNGEAIVKNMTEFYLDADDPAFYIQVHLFLGNQKKFAGQVFLNVFEWQQNMFHQTVSRLNKSPDKSANVSFQFYYFKDTNVSDQRPIFLSQERHHKQYLNIERENMSLMNQNLQLQKQADNWTKKNQELEQGRCEKFTTMFERSEMHKMELDKEQIKMQKASHECSMQMEMKEELQKLANSYKEKSQDSSSS